MLSSTAENILSDLASESIFGSTSTEKVIGIRNIIFRKRRNKYFAV